MSDGESSETETGRTTFTYGDGGVPLYVGIIWVIFVISYIAVMCAVALPDFLTWISS